MTHYFMLEKLGARIRQLRITMDMTQDKLSIESDVEKAMISRIESGRTNITIRTLYKISQALDVDIIEIFKD